MQVQVIQYTDEAKKGLVTGKIAIVIDVFRATSVITTALANGAKNVIVTKTVEEAKEEFNRLKQENCILGGERKMQKIAGFHFGNSPLDYMDEKIKDKTVILTTTNGTQAIHYSEGAAEIYICSMLNCSQVAELLAAKNQDVAIICSGLHNSFALEDALCAGKLLSLLSNLMTIEISDFEFILKIIYEKHKDNLVDLLQHCKAYKKLKINGFQTDLDFCLKENIYSVIPKYKNRTISI